MASSYWLLTFVGSEAAAAQFFALVPAACEATKVEPRQDTLGFISTRDEVSEFFEGKTENFPTR